MTYKLSTIFTNSRNFISNIRNLKIKTEQHKLYRIDRISKRSLDEWNSTVTISGVTSAINDTQNEAQI